MALHAGSTGGATSVAATAFPLLGPNGSKTAPTYSFASLSSFGVHISSGNDAVNVSVNGTDMLRVGTGTAYVPSGSTIGFSSNADVDAALPDVALSRDAAAVLALKNSDTAQTMRIYGASTGSKYLQLTHNATDAVISSTFGLITLTTVDISTAANVVTHTATATITGGVTDAYTAGLRLTPTFSAATAQTVTRYNYIDVNQPTLSGAGPAAMTDACVFRFNAAAGTHKAVDSGTTKTSPGTVTQWIKANVNGTIAYIPSYSSKTS